MRPSEYQLIKKLFDHYMNKTVDERNKKCYDLDYRKPLFKEERKNEERKIT